MKGDTGEKIKYRFPSHQPPGRFAIELAFHTKTDFRKERSALVFVFAFRWPDRVSGDFIAARGNSALSFPIIRQ